MFELEFTSTVVRWQGGTSAWHFLTLPEDLSRDIESWFRGRRGGWGSVKVEASIGATTWSTSIFPDRRSGGFLLPVKAAVRTAEGLVDGTEATVTLRL